MTDQSFEDAKGHGSAVDPGNDPPPARTERPARLSVNLGSGPAAALRDLMNRKEISATEAIRRAISVWKFIEEEQGRGNRIAVIETTGGKQNVREVLFRIE